MYACVIVCVPCHCVFTRGEHNVLRNYGSYKLSVGDGRLTQRGTLASHKLLDFTLPTEDICCVYKQ